MRIRDRSKQGVKAIWFSVVGNLVLTLIKLAAGVASNSAALVADSVHSLTDLFSSVIIWIGFKYGSKPWDKQHPHGHGDAEGIAGLIVAVLLAVIAFEFGQYALTSMATPGRTVIVAVAAPIAILSLVVKEVMARYTFKISKNIKSHALEADAHHHRSDSLSSLLVLVGIFGSSYFPLLDPIIALLIAAYVFYLAIRIGEKNIYTLMGTVPSPDLVDSIKADVLAVKGTQSAHNIRIHYLGFYGIVDLHVVVDGTLSLKKAHEIVHKVEEKLKRRDDIRSAVVHVDPGKHGSFGKRKKKR